MPSINGKMDSEEEDMDQDTPDSDKSDSRSSHSGSGSDEEESSGMKQLDIGCHCRIVQLPVWLSVALITAPDRTPLNSTQLAVELN